MKKYLPLIVGASLLVVGIGVTAYPAIQSIVGLAVASTTTTWNSLKDAAAGDNLTTGVVAGGCYAFDGTNWDGCRGDTTNGLDVDVTRLPAVVGATTPVDAFTNPTTALTTFSLNGEYNGTTWDLVRTRFTQTTTGIVGNAAGTAVNMTTTPMSKYTLIIDRTVGSTDAVAVNLECSYDGTIWPGTTQSLIAVSTLAVEPTRNSVGDAPCNYMRYNVVTVGAGNTLTIQLIATR